MSVKFINWHAGLSLLGFACFCQAAIAQGELPGSEVATIEEPFPIFHQDIDKVPQEFRRQEVLYDTPHDAGTVVVDADNRYLYFVLPEGRAIRYGIGVGRQGFEWNGSAEIGRKTPWPKWFPPKAMVARDPFAAKWRRGMPGGPKNPLGARALYLYANGADTLYRIHGTNQPSSIGQAVSSGCVRMLNADVIDLYERVTEGTKVVVMATKHEPVVATKTEPPKRKRRKIARREPEAAFPWFQSPRRVTEWTNNARSNVALKPTLVRKKNFNLNKTGLASR
jgi:lipoprotein-anchoring transpeptidase ErfK/SrfK